MENREKYRLYSPQVINTNDNENHNESHEFGLVHAGFPSPAEDIPETKLDLNRYIVQHPASTFFLRVEGVSMIDADFDEGDIIVVDKALEPSDGCVAVCYIDGEFTLKRVSVSSTKVTLIPANDSYPKIEITPENDFMIWGVVTYIIKKVGTTRR